MTAKNKAIVRLSPDAEGFGKTPDELEAEDFSSAVPVQHTHSYWDDDGIGLYVGLWDTESMTEAGGPYACDEFMWLIEGECQIRNNKTGKIDTIRAGTPFVIPKGYDCQWQQSGYLRKFYVISEHPGEAMPAAPAHEGVVIPRANAVLTEVVDAAPFAVTSGARPQQNICYEDTVGRFYAGTWVSNAFDSEQCPFPYNEFAYVQDGSITLQDAEGAAQVFNVGDAFFIPEGTTCRASVSESVRLYIAVVRSS
jgi:uncharacterized cupin superfamily protein